MPRNVKESDDDVETKSAVGEMHAVRRTRASVNSSVLDSPLRRSTRIKHPSPQETSSPESISDNSNMATTRTTRRRATNADTAVSEGGRNLRVRRNSAASDISELTETESLPDGPAKRITRRSVAGVTSVETPTKLNSRTRRTTRAGSETKSTPPVVRVTRRTRASSMEPEMIEETNDRQFGTPVKSRRRASVMPSEPVVNEESDDGKSINVKNSDENTVFEVDENDSETSPENIATSLRQKPKDDANESDEKMEVDTSSVKASEADTVERSIPEIAESTIDPSSKIEDSSKIVNINDESVKNDEKLDEQKISTPSKNSSQIIDNIVTKSIEKQEKSPGNKENEISNNGVGNVERNLKVTNNDVRSINKKAYANLFKITEQRRRGSNENESLIDNKESKTSTRTEEIATKESEKRPSDIVSRKEYLVDDCVVVIEPMDINQVDKANIVSETSVISVLSKTGDDTIPNIESNSVLVQRVDDQIDTSVMLISENNENSTKDKDIIDGDSRLKLLNATSMSVSEEKSDKEIEAVEENNEEIIQNNKSIETIDFEINNEENEKETSLKVTNEIVSSDENGKERSIETAETKDSKLSINDKKSDENDENFVCEMVKEKSSIVTESPVSGTNVEEASGLNNEQNKDKSTLVEDSSEAIQKDNEAKSSPMKKIVAGSNILETDNESDCSGYPAFKDITADEWTGSNKDNDKKNNEDETNSVFSASTERNESECEIELVDKESLNSVDKRKEVQRESKLDYDTDDTAITEINPEIETTDKNTEQMKVINEETPMDLSSDVEESEENTSNSPKKRLSSINKNASPTNFTVRRGASFINTDDESTMPDSPDNEQTNISIKSKKSPNKSPKKRTPSSAARRKIEESSDDEDTENSVNEGAKTTQTPNRKSIDASAKNLSANKNNVSAKNTPSANEIKTNETATKRRSSNKFSSVYSFNESDESPQNLDRSKLSTGSGLTQSTQSEIDDAEISLKISATTPQDNKKQNRKSNETGSVKKIETNKSICEDSESAPDSSIDGKQTEKSEKQASPKKSVNKNINNVSELNKDTELDDVCEKSAKQKSPKKSVNDKENFKTTPMSSGIPNEELNESTKSNNSRKLSINKNSPKFMRNMQMDSDSEDSKEGELSAKLNKSNLSSQKDNSKLSKLIDSDSESDTNISKKIPSSTKVTPQNKFDKSAKSLSARKLSISKNSSKNEENNSDSDDNEELEKKSKESIIEKASKFFIDADKNCSTIAQVNSDSEAVESSSSDDDGDESLIPQLFFERDSTSSSNSSAENDDSSDTIDSDVARDLNLHGKSTIEYSDDDVPADDCMVTETESSDSDDDGADLLNFVVDDDDDENSFDEEQSNDSFTNVNEKIRKRIITNLESDSDFDNNVEIHPTTDNINLDKSANTKTPKKEKKLNKSQEIAESEIPSDELNLSSKIGAKKNKNLLLQSSTPNGTARESILLKKDKTPKSSKTMNKSWVYPDKSLLPTKKSLTPLSKSLKNDDTSLKKDETPKSVTPLSKSLKNVDTSLKKDETPKSVTPLSKSLKNVDTSLKKDETPKSVTPLSKSLKNVDSSLKKDNTPKSVTPLSKSLKNADSSMNIETVATSSAEKLPKSVCDVVETPTKLGSSLKIAKTPKTPKTPITDEQKLQTSLPTDLIDSATKTNLSKTKSTKLSSLNQTMITPNSDTSETRFLMKEKLNDSLPALKLQQKIKASRRSTLDNVCEEIPSTEENIAKVEDKIKQSDEKNVTITEENAAVVSEIGSEKKKKNKKKKAKNIDTSNDPETEISSMPKELKRTLNVNENTENLENDVSDKISKKRNKKKKISETETEPIVLSQTEEISTKNKKKKKIQDNIEEIRVNDENKNDKTKKKKKKQIEVVDETQNDEIMKKQTKKNKKREETEEIAVAPLISKKKLRMTENNIEANDSTDSKSTSLSDQKKQTKKKQLQSSAEIQDQRKIKTRQIIATDIETLSKTNLKRLSDEIIESLSETPERPKKRRKIVKTEKIVPSRTMFDSRHQPSMNLNVDDGYISLSASGATTQFQVVNLKKTAKKSKKTVAAITFRERMLARNPRQPISAYLMYQQKQKASGKDRPY